MRTSICMRKDFVGQRALLLLLLLATAANGQFYGRSLPCPTSYLDPDGDCVAGIAGKDYPLHATFPKTSFKCSDHSVKLLGYFADPASSCQVFHVCLHDGRQESFLCPNGTLFNQQFLVCDWWFNVKCNEAYKFYQINEYFQAPVNFRPGPVHPNSIPIPSDSSLATIEKMDNFEQISTSASNNNNDSPDSLINSGSFASSSTGQRFNSNLQKGSAENSHLQDYDIMPRRPENAVDEMLATSRTTTTTETPINPASIGWPVFGLKALKDMEGGAYVRNSTLPPGLPRMLKM